MIDPHIMLTWAKYPGDAAVPAKGRSKAKAAAPATILRLTVPSANIGPMYDLPTGDPALPADWTRGTAVWVDQFEGFCVVRETLEEIADARATIGGFVLGAMQGTKWTPEDN
jgi:hypothetical protein